MLIDFLSHPIWKEYKEHIDNLIDFMGTKTPVLFGYQGQGYFLKWFLDKYSGPYEWIIVDNRDYIFDCGVVKPIEISLGLVNVENSILLVNKKHSPQVAEQINLMGYQNRKYGSVINTLSLFQANAAFFSWIESTRGLDILNEEVVYDKASTCRNYSSITERAVVSIEECFPPKMPVLDIGSGKGAAAIYFASCGRKVGLAEYNFRLFQISKDNFSKLGLDGIWYLGDASLLNEELDCWSCFCLFNPFVRDTFYKFIDALVSSIKRNPRHVYVAYGNPLEANYMFKVGFKLKERILTDSSCRYWLLFEFPL